MKQDRREKKAGRRRSRWKAVQQEKGSTGGTQNRRNKEGKDYGGTQEKRNADRRYSGQDRRGA